MGLSIYRFISHLWQHNLGCDQKNKIMDKRSCNLFPLQDVWVCPSGLNINYVIFQTQAVDCAVVTTFHKGQDTNSWGIYETRTG